MRNYEEKMYSLGESISGQTHAMSQAIQKTLKSDGSPEIIWRELYEKV